MRIKQDFNHEIIIERSRFLCYLHRAFNETEARHFIQEIKKAHPDANHHCSAFIIGSYGEIQRCSDDREPSGTAGVPMLQALKNKQIQDVCAVVVRYFGGVKLGAGGLVRAYSRSVSETVQLAPKTQTIEVGLFQLSFSYDWIGKIDYLLKNRCDIFNKHFDEKVSYQFYCSDDQILNEIQECTAGQAVGLRIKTVMIEREIL